MKTFWCWFPNLNAWMSAFFLIVLDRGLEKFWKNYWDLLRDLPYKQQLLVLFLIILSPILIVAIAHHSINLFLGLFSPSSKSPEMRKYRNWFPGIISWWEGLYGWQSLVLSSLITIACELIFFSGNELYSTIRNLFDSWYEPQFFFNRITLIRAIAIAFLYQFEYLVRIYLIAVGAGDNSD